MIRAYVGRDGGERWDALGRSAGPTYPGCVGYRADYVLPRLTFVHCIADNAWLGWSYSHGIKTSGCDEGEGFDVGLHGGEVW